MEKLFLIGYDEIFLKSEEVKRRMESLLIRNIKKALKMQRIKGVFEKERGRIYLKLDEKSFEKGKEILKNTFGISFFALCYRIHLSQLNSFIKKNWHLFLEKNKTFAVRVKRVGKHDFKSQDIEREVGGYIPLKVNLSSPQQTLFIEIRDTLCYVYSSKFKYPGLKGLPCNSSKKVVLLFSGGFDSTSSLFLLLKRGVEPILLYLEKEEREREKVIEIVKEFKKFYPYRIKIYIGDWKPILTSFSFLSKRERKMICILCKRAMLKFAEEIAKKEKAYAIATGDILNSVASQTLQNISFISEKVNTCILRPLVTFDKKESIEITKKIGLFEKCSKISAKKCLFLPKKPKVELTEKEKVKVKEIEKKIKCKIKFSILYI